MITALSRFIFISFCSSFHDKYIIRLNISYNESQRDWSPESASLSPVGQGHSCPLGKREHNIFFVRKINLLINLAIYEYRDEMQSVF